MMVGARLYKTEELARRDAEAMRGWPTPAILPQCEYEGEDHEPYAPGRCWARGPWECDGYVIRVHKGGAAGLDSWTRSVYVLEDDRVGEPG